MNKLKLKWIVGTFATLALMSTSLIANTSGADTNDAEKTEWEKTISQALEKGHEAREEAAAKVDAFADYTADRMNALKEKLAKSGEKLSDKTKEATEKAIEEGKENARELRAYATELRTSTEKNWDSAKSKVSSFTHKVTTRIRSAWDELTKG